MIYIYKNTTEILHAVLCHDRQVKSDFERRKVSSVCYRFLFARRSKRICSSFRRMVSLMLIDKRGPAVRVNTQSTADNVDEIIWSKVPARVKITPIGCIINKPTSLSSMSKKTRSSANFENSILQPKSRSEFFYIFTNHDFAIKICCKVGNGKLFQLLWSKIFVAKARLSIFLCLRILLNNCCFY